MKKDTLHVKISFNRTDLFEFCKLGFIPCRIGSLWCEGWVMSDRLAVSELKYEIL